MTLRRRGRKPKHVTAHKRAMVDRNTRKLVAHLRKRWKKMGRLERGERLRELIVLGCSTRGLQTAVGQSATTVRRHVQIANLPAKERKAVEAGASVKNILAKKAIVDRQKRRQARVDLDRKTGALSDEAASMILEFCRAKGNLLETSILRAEIELFSNSVRSHLYRFQAAGQGPIKVPKRLGIHGLFKQTRPARETDEFWFERQAKWLAAALQSRTPERLIWESALQKADRRSGELLQ